MAQTVTRVGNFNLRLLAEEVEAAAPELFDTVDGVRVALFSLTYDGTTLTARLPDGFPLSKLAGIAAAHDPTGESINQEASRRLAELRQGIISKFLALGFTSEELKYIKQVLA